MRRSILRTSVRLGLFLSALVCTCSSVKPNHKLLSLPKVNSKCNDAYVSYVTPTYLSGGIALAAGLQRFWEVERAIVFLVDENFPEYHIWRPLLRRICIDLRRVHSIANPYTPKQSRFQTHRYFWNKHEGGGVFTKLHAFNLTDFQKVLLLDSDQLVLQSYDELFNFTPFAAGPQHVKDYSHFASGTMLLTPNASLFIDLVQKLGSLKSFDGADMGFLNSYFSDLWQAQRKLKFSKHRFPWYFVAYRRSLEAHPAEWSAMKDKIKGVDCTGSLDEKPWSKDWVDSGPYSDLYRKWWDNYKWALQEEHSGSIDASLRTIHDSLQRRESRTCHCMRKHW